MAPLTAGSALAAPLQWGPPTNSGQRVRATLAVAAAPTRPAATGVQLASWNEPVAAPQAFGAEQVDGSFGIRQAAQFDPFEATEPQQDAIGQRGAPAEADPFDSPDMFGQDAEPVETTEEPEAIDDSSSAASDVWSEPVAIETSAEEAYAAPPARPLSSPQEELRAADQAIEQELVRREAQESLAAEMPAIEGAVEEELVADEEQELPGFDSASAPSNLDKFTDEPRNWRHDDGAVQATPEQEAARRERIAAESAQAEKDCRRMQELARQRKLTDISLDIGVKGNPGEDFPFECGLGDELFTGRSWPEITYRWKAAGLCHKPLYFEQAHLERYGHSWGPLLDPVVSGAHFFASLPILPYKMGLQTPNECVYTLGHYRPGSCAPYMIEPVPFTWRAAAFQGFITTGTAFVIP
ncbi:MAG: hypothetical protein KF688_09715 [Pirellulales bacterium]|nr:hypothetical protein [Pirellulales bacterium]